MTVTEPFSAAISRARSESSPRMVIDGVKDVIEQQLKDLSPEAEIQRTSYFNHSYMPDLVMEWGGKRGEVRPVFIRNHLEQMQAAAQIGSLSSSEGVVVPLDPVAEGNNVGTLRETAFARAPRVLVVDSQGLGQMAEELQSRERSTPLLDLVGHNLLRGGKGLLTEADATRLSEATDVDLAAEGSQVLAEFDGIAVEYFQEDAALRLRRAAEIVRIALTHRAGDALLTESTGDLSDAELSVLLPYLLDLPGGRVDPQFWAFIGSLTSLERLEQLWTAIGDRDVTALVQANLATWFAKRSQVTLNASFDEDEGASPAWQFRSGLLTGTAGPWMVWLSAVDSRRLRGRDGDNTTPLWSAISPSLLATYEMESIELRGIQRRVNITAEQSSNIAGDVAAIETSIEDRFHVFQTTVRPRGTEEGVAAVVEFSPSLATVKGGRMSVEDLSGLAMGLLGHSRPLDEGTVTALLGK